MFYDLDAAIVTNYAPKPHQPVFVLFKNLVQLPLLLFHVERVLFEAHVQRHLLMRRHLVQHGLHLLICEFIPEFKAVIDSDIVPKTMPLSRVKCTI